MGRLFLLGVRALGVCVCVCTWSGAGRLGNRSQSHRTRKDPKGLEASLDDDRLGERRNWHKLV